MKSTEFSFSTFSPLFINWILYISTLKRTIYSNYKKEEIAMSDISRFLSVTILFAALLVAVILLPFTISYLVLNPVDRETFLVVSFFCLVLFTL